MLAEPFVLRVSLCAVSGFFLDGRGRQGNGVPLLGTSSARAAVAPGTACSKQWHTAARHSDSAIPQNIERGRGKASNLRAYNRTCPYCRHRADAERRKRAVPTQSVGTRTCRLMPARAVCGWRCVSGSRWRAWRRFRPGNRTCRPARSRPRRDRRARRRSAAEWPRPPSL